MTLPLKSGHRRFSELRIKQRRRMQEKAVALTFDPDDPAIPTITASGRGVVARQILELAFANGVKVREDPDLVEILATLEVGAEIPVIAFAAVAEILSHVYRWETRERERTEPNHAGNP